MNSRKIIAEKKDEQENKFHKVNYILTEKYPHICQNPRCKKKVKFGWLYSRAEELGISYEELIEMWINPSYEEIKDKPIKFLCYSCYEKKLRKERVSKDPIYKQLWIYSTINHLFRDLIKYKHSTILLRNDDNIKGQIWYETLIIHTFLKIYKIKQKITGPKILENWAIEKGIRNFTETNFIDIRITTLYFKMKWSIWKIKRYYMKRYQKLPDDRKKRNLKPTLKRIKEEIRKDKRFESK